MQRKGTRERIMHFLQKENYNKILQSFLHRSNEKSTNTPLALTQNVAKTISLSQTTSKRTLFLNVYFFHKGSRG